MSVSDVVQNFKQIERSNSCYVYPNIPPKKLRNCVESFCFSGKQVDFLLDDTIWGSAKDGLAISNGNLYYKQLAEGAKNLDLSAVKDFTYEKRTLGNIEIFCDGMPFLTITAFDKAYHGILMDLLNASAAEARRINESKSEQTPAAKVKKRTPASEPAKKGDGDRLNCFECSADLPRNAKFCLECGAKVMPKGICLACNNKMPEEAKFCQECGTPAGQEAGFNKQVLGESTLSSSDTNKVRNVDADEIRAELSEHRDIEDEGQGSGGVNGEYLNNNSGETEEMEKYIRLADDRTVTAAIAYKTIEDSNTGDIVVHGAYYGYCGGGVNEGGYFVIDRENDNIRALDYSDIDDIEADDPEQGRIYNGLMQMIWTLIDDNDESIFLTPEGSELFAKTSDTETYMSPEFDGDDLDEVSKLWQLSLKFES